MPSWIGFVIGGVGLLNTLLIGVLVIGRWTQKVEAPVTLALLSRDIADLTKEIQALREVFDRRYVGLEGRHNTDHEKLRMLLTDKAVNDVRMSEMRRDLDEVRRRCGILNPSPHEAIDGV